MERKNRANETRAKEAENQTKHTERERERERERETEETDKAEVKWRLWIIYHQDTKTHEK